MQTLEEKILDAENILRLGAEISDHYYNAPLILCYSGGKDSDVMVDIARKCLTPNQFEVLNSHTTVDAPETVYHIREVFKELNAQGIKTTIKLPRDKDGKLISMWSLIESKGMHPTRITRYCCSYLKEASTPHRIVAIGIREDESSMRKGRDAFVTRGYTKAEMEVRSLNHTYAMFELDKLGKDDAYECQLIKAFKKNRDTMCNPIYKFTEEDVWHYAKKNKLKMNPLYKRGYSRVGCIGCPLGGPLNQLREFSDYPKYKDNYIRAFDRMCKRNAEKGQREAKRNLLTGEDWFNWWIGENPNQINLF